MDLLSRNSVGSIPYTNNFSFSEVSPKTVLKIVKNFKASDSLDVYDLSCNLFKKVVDCVVHPLTYCLNMCLREGYFPVELKMSRVVPVYKKGQKDSPSSYRPISIVPVFAKVFETVIYVQLNNYVESVGILNDAQFGFRKQKSTVDAIDGLVKNIHKVFEDKCYAQATFCDLSKAFDCVDHNSLLQKLKFYGVGDIGMKLLTSYLKNRSQLVSVGKEKSNLAQVVTGVPQGSVLGPFLFLIMINDLPSSVETKTFLYADDTTFLCTSKDFNSLKTLTDSTIVQASHWFRANGFLLNENKTQQMCFSLRDRLPSDDPVSVKFLGIYIDSKLTWESHINYICGKLSRVIYLLRSLSNCLPNCYLRSSYFSFFQSIVIYGIILWGNSCHVNQVLLLQKKAVRVISGSSFKAHCRPLFVELRILTVINLYIYYVLIHTKNKILDLKCRNQMHLHNTRNSSNLFIPYYRLSKSLNSYEVIGHKLFNKLPSNLQNLPNPKFKQSLYNWLLHNPFYKVDEFIESNVNF